MPQGHLNEDQIIWAVVDETELPPSIREHLAQCPDCRGQKAALEYNLKALGNTAVRFAPYPKRPFVLPEVEARLSRSHGWSVRRHSWGLAPAMCAVFVALFLGWSIFFKLPQNRLARVEEGMQKDRQFMTEINNLVEDPLLQEYKGILGGGYIEVNEDFIDFVVPQAEKG